ncbi:MAG: TlpA family protein disulfide reductase [Putridiphycobacter sp.]
MKKLILSSIAFVGLVALMSMALDETEKGKKLPSVNIKNLEGEAINTANVSNDGKPIVVSFWATWCKPCKLELNTIADEYEDWQEETGVKLVAVSIDDQRTVNSVKPTVNTNGWDYDIWLDTNGDFKRAMGVNYVPHTFLLDGEGNIVYSHNNFVPGDEEELYEQILKISK